MYAPTNTVINAAMRWPLLAAAGSAAVAASTTGVVAHVAAVAAGSVVGALGLTKAFNKQLCNCEEKGYHKLKAPRIDWIIEFDSAHGVERPWKVYSIFAGFEYTKQHYASYSTEEHAQARIEELKKLADRVENKSDD